VVKYRSYSVGARLMAGQQTLNLYVEVRLLCPQPAINEEKKRFLLVLIL
jgi:hypothetical protein